jgi:hypothetical protein
VCVCVCVCVCGAEIIFSKPTNKGFLPDLVSQGMLLNLLSFRVTMLDLVSQGMLLNLLPFSVTMISTVHVNHGKNLSSLFSTNHALHLQLSTGLT